MSKIMKKAVGQSFLKSENQIGKCGFVFIKFFNDGDLQDEFIRTFFYIQAHCILHCIG